MISRWILVRETAAPRCGAVMKYQAYWGCTAGGWHAAMFVQHAVAGARSCLLFFSHKKPPAPAGGTDRQADPLPYRGGTDRPSRPTAPQAVLKAADTPERRR